MLDVALALFLAFCAYVVGTVILPMLSWVSIWQIVICYALVFSLTGTWIYARPDQKRISSDDQ